MPEDNDDPVEARGRLFTQFEPGGSRGPIEDKSEYEKLINGVADSDLREFLVEASHFATTWQYLSSQAMQLPPKIASDVASLKDNSLSVRDRVARMHDINQRLMEYLDQHDRQSPAIRQ